MYELTLEEIDECYTLHKAVRVSLGPLGPLLYKIESNLDKILISNTDPETYKTLTWNIIHSALTSSHELSLVFLHEYYGLDLPPDVINDILYFTNSMVKSITGDRIIALESLESYSVNTTYGVMLPDEIFCYDDLEVIINKRGAYASVVVNLYNKRI